MAYRILSGEELLSIFSRKEPNELQQTITHLADENARLADENARLRRDQRRLHAYILGKENGGGKSVLEWINNARLAGAHFALTARGDSYTNAATTLIRWCPAIRKLLKKNLSSTSFTDEERIIQLRKNFNSGRATKNKAIRVAYR